MSVMMSRILISDPISRFTNAGLHQHGTSVPSGPGYLGSPMSVYINFTPWSPQRSSYLGSYCNPAHTWDLAYTTP